MPTRLFRLYQRKRIINIHVNAVMAGLLAIALAKLPVRWVGIWIGEDQPFLNALAAYAIDSVFDVAVYFGLHWVANHWTPLRPRSRADVRHRRATKPSFLRDVATVQAERIVLVPVFAAVGIGGMWALQKHAGWDTPSERSWAFVVAFVSGIVVTRLLHTLLGLWTGSFVDHHDRASRRPARTTADASERPRAADRHRLHDEQSRAS
ncbi:MAG: hypothetical protein ACF8Q5_04935 [Phycisphaerales bacterium JB040]